MHCTLTSTCQPSSQVPLPLLWQAIVVGNQRAHGNPQAIYLSAGLTRRGQKGHGARKNDNASSDEYCMLISNRAVNYPDRMKREKTSKVIELRGVRGWWHQEEATRRRLQKEISVSCPLQTHPLAHAPLLDFMSFIKDLWNLCVCLYMYFNASPISQRVHHSVFKWKRKTFYAF